MIMIDTLNMALRFEAVPVSASGPSLYAGSEISLSASHADIGAAVRRVLKAAAVLQTHGMFEEIA
jgi:hypothetical protein